jgi:serine/threonine protein kinase
VGSWRCVAMDFDQTGRPTDVTGDAFPTPERGDGSLASRCALERPGDFVGPYKLVSVLGEGGFGTVWLAERREPMVQRVALKIIKPGMDSSSVIARFEQERQALAVMDHPNVARVFDGGVTERGRPYFVMELVKGAPITAYADRQRLTLRERLALFVPVCEAVQHAHIKGIIHRDLKPSNVLVEHVDGRSVVKVIDFGIAKATDASAVQHSVFSMEGQFIGTPEYMSPEQAGGHADVDTRTDVYALGVTLYELLVGALPFDPTELRRRGFDEIRRIIREEEPPRPSTRLSTFGGSGEHIASARRESRDSIVRSLRRELEWIPLKAMRKERDRRYESAAALADDIRRYLEGRALRAAPESRVYLARKFVRRNRVLVGASAAVFLSLAAGFGAALWQAREAARERDAATAARDAERERADQLKQVSDFQSRMLAQVDTTRAGVDLIADVRERYAAALEREGVPDAERMTRSEAFQQELVRVNSTDAAAMIDRTILRPAVETIDREFKDQPTVDAQLRQSLADLYQSIGLHAAAMPLQESALATRRRVLGEAHPETITSISNMGHLLHAQSRLPEAEALTLEAVEKNRQILGVDHPNTLAAVSNMGTLLQSQGKLAEAEPFSREAYEGRRRVLGEDHPDTFASLSNLAHLLQEQGKLAEAETYAREVLAQSRRTMGNEHPVTLASLNNLGALLQLQGKLAEAEVCQRETLEVCRRVFGEDHPNTLVTLGNVGVLLREQGKLDEAEPFIREGLERHRRLWGDEHPRTLISFGGMGLLLVRQGRHAEAIELLAPIEPAFRGAFTGGLAPRLATMLTTLGSARIGVGFDPQLFALAESNMHEAHAILFAASDRGQGHKETIACVRALVDLYAAWHAAEPGKGYDAKASEWRAALEGAGGGG